MTNRIEIPFSKGFAIFGTLFLTGFVILFSYKYFYEDPRAMSNNDWLILVVLDTLSAGTCIYFIFKFLIPALKGHPAIIIEKDTITDYVRNNSISWEDVKGFRLGSFGSFNYIGIELKEDNAFINQKRNVFKKLLMVNNRFFYGTPLLIPTQYVAGSDKKLLALFINYLETRQKAHQANTSNLPTGLNESFICDPDAVKAKLSTLSKTGASADGWIVYYTDDRTKEIWHLTQFGSEQQAGGIFVLKKLPELNTEALIDLALSSPSRNDIIGASNELYERERHNKEDFREKLLERLSAINLIGLSEFEKERIRLIIDETSLYDATNLRNIVRKQISEIQHDADHYRDMAAKAKAILNQIK